MKSIIDILLFIFFVCVFVYSLGKILNRYSRKKVLLVGIVAFVSVSALYVAFALLILLLCKNSNVSPQIIQSYFLKAYLSLVVLILINIFIALSNIMISGIVGFHEEHNVPNIKKQPVKFAVKNKKPITNIYKYFFIIGGCVMLFIIWFLMSANIM